MQRVLVGVGAVACLVVAAALLGFVNLATYEAVTSWGLEEGYAEIASSTWNLTVFSGCWVLGLAALCLGLGSAVSLCHPAPRASR
jgi:hypothetical protein